MVYRLNHTFTDDNAALAGIADGTTQAKGTWTPTIVGSTTDPTVTYTSRAGTWVRTGNFIHIEWDIQYSALSGGSGFVCIGGMSSFLGTPLKSQSRGYGWLTHPGGIPTGYLGLSPFLSLDIFADGVGFQYVKNTDVGFDTYPFASIASAGGTNYMFGAIDYVLA
jgi:hypothetical protein